MILKKEYTPEQIAELVDRIGCSGGGTIEVTGPNNGAPMSILISQTEWHGSPACLVGGYGQRVMSVNTDNVKDELTGALDYYFDYASTLTVKKVADE